MSPRKAPIDVRYKLRNPLTLSPSGFLLDSASGESFSLNPSGQCVVNALIGGGDAQDACRALIDRFDVDEGDARRDVERFLASMWELDLVERDDAPRAGAGGNGKATGGRGAKSTGKAKAKAKVTAKAGKKRRS